MQHAERQLKGLLYKCRASDKCQREKRKTINGDDLLWAMSTLGFEEYFEPLKLYLHKYREVTNATTTPPISAVPRTQSPGELLTRCSSASKIASDLQSQLMRLRDTFQ